MFVAGGVVACLIVFAWLGQIRWEPLIQHFRNTWGLSPVDADAWTVRVRKALHVPLYVGVAWLVARRWRMPRPWLPIAATALAIALADESIQAMFPGRTARWGDLGLDAIGIALGTWWCCRKRAQPSIVGSDA